MHAREIQHSRTSLCAWMFNYSHKQQMALLSFNFSACDWDLGVIQPTATEEWIITIVS